MNLPHQNPDCTGRWAPKRVNGTMFWKCVVCGAAGSGCTANHVAAIQENMLAERLALLAEEGRMLLDTEGTVP